jgi:sRNA-binding carbon storage regulator CsrA
LTSWRIDILVLSKKPSEQVVIGGGITASGASVLGNKVRLAFTVPDQDRILRAELACRQDEPAGCDEPADPACSGGEEDVRPPR